MTSNSVRLELQDGLSALDLLQVPFLVARDEMAVSRSASMAAGINISARQEFLFACDNSHQGSFDCDCIVLSCSRLVFSMLAQPGRRSFASYRLNLTRSRRKSNKAIFVKSLERYLLTECLTSDLIRMRQPAGAFRVGPGHSDHFEPHRHRHFIPCDLRTFDLS